MTEKEIQFACAWVYGYLSSRYGFEYDQAEAERIVRLAIGQATKDDAERFSSEARAEIERLINGDHSNE